MKKRLFLILSVAIMLAAGCGDTDSFQPDMGTEATETVMDAEEPDMAEDKEIPAADQAENRDTEKEQAVEQTAKGTGQEKGDKEAGETPEPKSASQPDQQEETEPAQGSTDVTKQEETKPEETKQQEQTVTAVSYDPVSVCSRAVAKCQAGGMITTTDNLASLLAEGKITQEEYHSYYPYDGLGYYSVFVETDLNAASTTSGRKLGSEDGIADYIAGMMMLETEPVFYIEYTGVCSLNGTEFYEFRCYR